MRNTLLTVAVLVVAMLAVAAGAPPKAQPIPLANQVTLLKAQHDADQASMDLMKLNQQYTQIASSLQQRIAVANQALDKAKAQAYAAVKLDQKQWALNLDTLQFDLIPAPAAKAAPAKK